MQRKTDKAEEKKSSKGCWKNTTWQSRWYTLPSVTYSKSQASQARFSLSTFPLIIFIDITFLTDLGVGFALLCTNVADAILASTRVETGTSRAIKAGFSAAWGGKPGQPAGNYNRPISSADRAQMWTCNHRPVCYTNTSCGQTMPGILTA